MTCNPPVVMTLMQHWVKECEWVIIFHCHSSSQQWFRIYLYIDACLLLWIYEGWPHFPWIKKWRRELLSSTSCFFLFVCVLFYCLLYFPSVPCWLCLFWPLWLTAGLKEASLISSVCTQIWGTNKVTCSDMFLWTSVFEFMQHPWALRNGFLL